MTSRTTLTNQLLDRIARDLADDIIAHTLTEREVHMLAANLPGEAIHYAAEYKAEALRAAREERRAAV